jgi:hypothetical protein
MFPIILSLNLSPETDEALNLYLESSVHQIEIWREIVPTSNNRPEYRNQI